MNKFPRDFNSNLTGFGGDSSMIQSQIRAALKKTPIILVHGNASNSVDPKYGMQTIASFLTKAGYTDCEIWAMDYLGENNTGIVLQGVHRNHIEALRTFIDKVKDYLGVPRLDFIAHSLGCGMVNAYLRGLQADGTFDDDDNRFKVAGTFVCLAGANYGLGPLGIDEFQSGGPFEIASHKFHDITDDTPFGSNDKTSQIAPSAAWKVTTSLDNNQLRYVAFTAKSDFVDHQKADTGHRNGADLNKIYNLGQGAAGHEAIVKNQPVFDDFKVYLNQNPPVPPVKIRVDKVSGNYPANLLLTVTLEPAGAACECSAKRLTKQFQAGFIVESIAETKIQTLSNGQSLALANDGAWELVFSAPGAEDVRRTYGVNVQVPEVTILTDNGTPFKGHLEINASTTKGTVYVSLDDQHFNAASNISINATASVYFMAIDSSGIASATVSRTYERQPVPSATGTLTEHFIAHRINVNQYIELGGTYGFTAKITLYLVNDKWVLDPETAEVSIKAPLVHASQDSGAHAAPMTLLLTAQHPCDPAPTIFYTLDGSLPTENSPSFSSSGLLKLDKAGTRTVMYRARDAFSH